ncbi:hypothetical protein HK096_002962 [Nowakowskiella sp. JEL0078]|nr:hypothetical protein HK096_002962 [Nowakowskiella sp. JEL0078]
MKFFLTLTLVLFTNTITNALPAPEPSLSNVAHNCYADVILQANHIQRLRKRSAEGTAPNFGYEGSRGPLFWADLDPANEKCRTGKLQSPINFAGQDFLASANEKFTLDWKTPIANAEFLNEGITAKVILETESKVTFAGTEFKLKQFHFHTPSEHHIDERSTDAEIHFVHVSDSGKILVLGVLVEIPACCAKYNALFSQLIPNLPIGPVDTKKTISTLDLSTIVKFFEETTFNTYEGSLTTPPCSEGVRFFVSTNRLKVPSAQIKELKKVVPFNARFTQANNGRGKSKTP